MMMAHTRSAPMKNLLLTVLTCAGLAFAHIAPAAEHGDGAKMGEKADTQMSPEGSLNQNSQAVPGAARGKDRAQERMDPMGMEHEQATKQETDPEKTAKAKKGNKAADQE